MIDLAALDAVFFTRLIFAMGAYWVLGIFSKGIFEPIQAHLGRELFRLFHRKTEDLDRRAADTRNKLDDLLVGKLAESSASLYSIINPLDLSNGDRRKLQEKVNATYSVSVLTQKALEKFPVDF